MNSFRGLVFATLMGCVGIAASAGVITTTPVGSLDANGWTEFTESPDTIKVYVSNSTGNDTNAGTIDAPVKTIAKAGSMTRTGKPDWILMKRGDTWNESMGPVVVAGRSASEPHVVMPYGTGPRPIVTVSTSSGIGYNGTFTQRFMAFTGIHFKKIADPPAPSLRWLGNADSFLFEDCLMEGPVIVQTSVLGDISNFAMRRCLVLDTWDPVKVQGVFTQKVDGILLEENIFDNNGYLDQIGTIGSSIVVNHNVYIQKDCANFCGRGNISMRAPSHGMQARVGGILDNNLFVNNAFGAVFGTGTVPGVVTRNVVLNGKDIPRSGADILFRAWGLEIHGIPAQYGAVISDNLIINDKSASDTPKGINLSGGVYNTEIKRNIIYNWRRPIGCEGLPGTDLGNISISDNIFVTFDNVRGFMEMDSIADMRSVYSLARNTYSNTALPTSKYFLLDAATNLSLAQWITTTGEESPRTAAPPFADPTRTIETYMQTLGFAATQDAFIAEVRKQSKSNWRPELSAPVINDWFRDGFTVVSNQLVAPADGVAPNPGSLVPSTPITNAASVTIAYSGSTDNVGGSGFNNIRLWFKKGTAGTWTPYGAVKTTPLGNFTFAGFSSADTYYFSTRAQDNAGNYSPVPNGAGMTNIVFSPPPAKLVLHAKLDDTPSDGVLDSSTFGNSGTVVGTGFPTVEAGQVGSAYTLSGTDQFINFNSVASKVAATMRMTVSMWVKLPPVYTNTAPQAPGALLGVNTSTGGNAIILMLGSTQGAQDDNTLMVMDGGSNSAIEGKTATVVADNAWHHVAYTSDNATGRLYVDGALVGSHEVNYTLAGTDTWSLGQEFDTAVRSNFIQGQMDDFQVWDGALADADIATLASGGAPNGGDQVAPDPGLPSVPSATNTQSIQVAFSGAIDNAGGSGLNNVRLWVKKGVGGTWQDSGLMQFADAGTFAYPGATEPETYFFGLQAEDNAGNKSVEPSGAGTVSTAHTPPPPTMILHAKFEDDPSDGVLDSSNGSNHGSALTGKIPTINATGKIGPAYQFDGIDDFVKIDAVADDLALSQKFSVAMWVKLPNTFTNTNGAGALVAANSAVGANVFMLFAGSANAADNNELVMLDGGVSGGASYEGQTNTIIADNAFHHVAYTSTGFGGTGKLYVDGVLKSSHTVDYVLSASDQWSIGQEYDSATPSNFIKNLLDEVKVWSGVLSANDVTAVFNGQDPTPSTDTTPPTTGSVSAPQFAKTSPIAVNYSNVIDSGGSGLKEVHLWAKQGAGGTWTDTGLVTTTASGTFNFAGASADGDYFFALQTKDNLDNTSATPSGSGGGTTKYDTTVPTAAGVTAPTNSGNPSLTLGYSGAADAGSGLKNVKLWVRKGAAAWTNTGLTQTTAAGSFTFATSGDATYFFATQVEDNAGNVSAVPSGNGSGSTVVDTTAPTAATVTAPQYAKTSPIALTYAGAADSGTGVKNVKLWVRKDAGAWTNTGQTQTAASGSFSFTPVGDGRYYFATQVEDNAGIVSPAPSGDVSSNTFFDTQAPVAASVTAPTATKTSPISLTYAGASDSGSGVKTVRLWSKKNSGSFADTGQSQTAASGAFSFTPSGDGAYSFATQVEDNAGNVSVAPTSGSATTSLDTTAPTPGTTTSVAATNSAPISVSYSGSTDALSGLKKVSLFVRKDAGAFADSGLSQTAGSGSFSYAPSSGSGTYYFGLVVEDNAGNVSANPTANGTSNSIYDVVKPTKGNAKNAAKSALPGFASTSPLTVDYDGAADQHSGLKTVKLWVRKNNGLWADTGLTQTGATGSFSYPVTLGDGSYQFTTVTEDKATNLSDTPTTTGDYSVVFDSAKPTPGVATSVAFTKTTPITVAYSGASDAQSGLQNVYLWFSKDGGPWTDSALAPQTASAGSFSFTSVAGDGNYRFATVAEDKAGSKSDTPVGNGDTSTIYDTTAPDAGTLSAPATEDGPPIAVTFSGVSDGAGSGVKSVRLFVSKDAGAFTDSGQTANGASGEIYFTAVSGDGVYAFALQTEDNAGNISAAPTAAQATTTLDTSFTPGTAVSPPFLQAGPITVTYSGAANSRGTGLAAVHLYFKKGSAGNWADSGLTQTGAAGSFEFTAVTGDDEYYFATVAEDDNGDTTKLPEGGGDTKTFVDSTPPEVEALVSPTYTNVQQITLTYTGVVDEGSGLKEVRLWVKKGAEGVWEDTTQKLTTPEGEFTYGPVAVEETHTFYLQAVNNADGKSPDPTDEIVFGPPVP